MTAGLGRARRATLGMCWLALASTMATAGCGKDPKPDPGKAGAGAGTAPARVLDCAVFSARLSTCANDFWTSYAGTERARANAKGGDVAGHVAEARATFEAVGIAKLCENERSVHADDPAWTRAVEGCASQSGCGAWAACAAPALFR